jgi:hypothetical protein
MPSLADAQTICETENDPPDSIVWGTSYRRDARLSRFGRPGRRGFVTVSSVKEKVLQGRDPYKQE